jgi:uncharacterized short protein YbdD (DUF466 family)
MNTFDLQNSHSDHGIKQTALNNYEIYLKHYRVKNLIPMSFEEFFKNYNS